MAWGGGGCLNRPAVAEFLAAPPGGVSGCSCSSDPACLACIDSVPVAGFCAPLRRNVSSVSSSSAASGAESAFAVMRRK